MSRPLALRVGIALSTFFLGFVFSAVLGEALQSLIVFSMSMIVTAWLTVRAFRIALIVDEHGVVVRNYFHTYRIQWHEIGAVGKGITSSFTLQLVAVVFRYSRTDRVVAAQATAGERESQRALRKLSQLRPELRTHLSA